MRWSAWFEESSRCCAAIRVVFAASIAVLDLVVIAGGVVPAQARGQEAPCDRESSCEVVAEEAEEPAAWAAVAVRGRKGDGPSPSYVRPSAEAFVDPDQPLALEPKYYFELELPEPTPSRAIVDEPPGWGDDSKLRPFVQLDLRQHPTFWMDDAPAARSSRTRLAALVPTEETASGLAMAVFRMGRQEAGRQEVGGDGDRGRIEKLLAKRDLPADAPNTPMLFAALGAPPPGTPGAGLLPGLLCYVERGDGRHAIRICVESLKPECDCRVLLPPEELEWGEPRAIAFVEIDLGTAPPRRQRVLAVWYGDRVIGLEYPLHRPALFERMQSAQARAPRTAEERPTLDPAKLLGEELVDEFSRRLVNVVAK